MNMFVIIIILLFILSFWVIGIYNKLVRLIEAIRNNKKQIDIQLDRRFKVFESLINVVKKYMDYESTTLKEVIALRSKAQNAMTQGDEKTRMAAEEGISKIASTLNVVFEQYPTLKADKNAMQLQEEIVNTENKLAYSKQAYNDSIEKYNALKRQFFESMVINVNKAKLDVNFIYWGISEDKAKALESHTVEM
jgi:LemA protein